MQVSVPSPQTTLLILLGATEWPLYPAFPRSEAFAHAARAVRGYFLDPRRFGLPSQNVLDLFNSNDSPDELDVQIGQFLEQRLATMRTTGNAARDLLVYFIGHGYFVGRDSDFCLAIRRTRTESLRASGLQMMSLADTLTEKARGLRRIIILDCCFAAAAFSAFQSDPSQIAAKKTADAFEVKHKGIGFPTKGTVLLCSSNQDSPSRLLPDGSSTMFTHALVGALTQGTNAQRDRLSLRDVKDVATDILCDIQDAPRPVVLSPDQSEGDVADIPFFPNPRVEEDRRRRAEEEQARQAEEEKHRQAEEERRRLTEEAERVRIAAEAEQTLRTEEEKQRRIKEERARLTTPAAKILARPTSVSIFINHTPKDRAFANRLKADLTGGRLNELKAGLRFLDQRHHTGVSSRLAKLYVQTADELKEHWYDPIVASVTTKPYGQTADELKGNPTVKAIEQCQILLVVLSPAAVASTDIYTVYHYAQKLGKRVILLKYKECKTVPPDFSNLESVNFTTEYDRGLEALYWECAVMEE